MVEREEDKERKEEDVEGDKEGKERGVMEIRRQRNKRVCQRWTQR